MSDERKASKPPAPSLSDALAALPRAPVDVLEPSMVVGEVRLADGTLLAIRVIVHDVMRVEGLRDETGRPVYQVQSVVIPTVKKWGQE